LKFGGEKVDLGKIVLLKAIKLYSSILGLVAGPGDKLLFPFVVSNIGGESEIVEFLVSGPEGWFTRILGQANDEVLKAALSPGLSLNFQLEVKIPLTSSGERKLTLTTVGKTNSSLDFIIKVQSSEKTIGEIISCQFPGKLCAPGETIRFPLSVKNPLGVKLQFRLNVKFFPSNWIVFVRNVGGEAVTIVTLEGGESVNLNVEVSVPAGESEGEYEIIFGASSSAVSRDLTLFVVVEEKLEGKP